MNDGSKILVVEDNDFVRAQIVRFLADEKYHVLEASDGAKALQTIKDVPDINVAIVDVRMEPIDGFEFVRSLRAMGLQTPVVLVTGDQNPDLLNESGKWGVSAVLMKPVQRDRLVKAVARIVQQGARS
jgi:CheY-like chemotaxis protein